MKYIFLGLLFLVVTIGMGQGVFAQEAPPGTFFGGGIPTGPQTGATFLGLLENIIDWVFVIILLFSVVFIILAGLQFITSGGDANAVAEARRKLLWAAIGIVVALLARGIPVVVRNIVGP